MNLLQNRRAWLSLSLPFFVFLFFLSFSQKSFANEDKTAGKTSTPAAAPTPKTSAVLQQVSNLQAVNACDLSEAVRTNAMSIISNFSQYCPNEASEPRDCGPLPPHASGLGAASEIVSNAQAFEQAKKEYTSVCLMPLSCYSFSFSLAFPSPPAECNDNSDKETCIRKLESLIREWNCNEQPRDSFYSSSSCGRTEYIIYILRNRYERDCVQPITECRARYTCQGSKP